MLSATLHALVAALLILFSFAAGRITKDEPKVFELVAGEGDNYGATVAPALGTEGGLKVNVPPAPAPEPAKPEPVKIEPAPITPAPPPPKPEVKPTPKEEVVPNFAKQMKQEVKKAETKAKREIAKQKAAEDKRLAEEKKKMSKAEFDAAHKVASATPTKSSAPNYKKLDPEGIKQGVVGGSTENKIGGQGGKALKSDNTDPMAAFYAMFKDRALKNFEAPPGLSDTLEAKIEIMSHANGTFSGARILKSSGSREFDEAALAAVKRVQMAPRPDKKSSSITFIFAMKDVSDR